MIICSPPPVVAVCIAQSARVAEMSQSVPVEELHVDGKPGAPIELPIARGPATGYVWRLELPAGIRQVADGPPRPVDPKAAIGAGTGAHLQVEAGAAGDYVITARLARQWEPDRPARIVRIRLHVAP